MPADSDLVRDLLAQGAILVQSGDVDGGLTRLAQAAAMSPSDAGLPLVAALMQVHRPEKALSALVAHAPPTDHIDWRYWLRWRAYAHAAAGSKREALADFRDLVHRFDGDADILEWVTRLTHEVERRSPETSDALLLEALSAARLPASLGAGLAALDAEPVDADVEEHPMLGWVARATNGHGLGTDEWLGRISWGRRAKALMLNWWRWKPDAQAELRALVDGGSLRAALERLEAAPGPTLLLCSHMGPLDAAVAALQDTDARFRRFGFAGHEPARAMKNGQLILSTGGAPLREILRALGRGEAVGWPMDAPFGLTVDLPLEGRRIRISATPARLVSSGYATAFWFQPLWDGDRVVIDCRSLPAPGKSEALGAFERRWYGAIAAGLGRALRSDPRNLLLAAGMWSPDVALKAHPQLAARARSRPVELDTENRAAPQSRTRRY